MKNWIDFARVSRQTNLLQGANLREANLWGANLREADLQGANLWRADLQGANLWRANLQGANLWRANLQGADLREANLWGANLDFSCWPLWCGSNNVKVDGRIARQLLLHACSLDLSGDPDNDEYLDCVAACLNFINGSHRFEDMA